MRWRKPIALSSFLLAYVLQPAAFSGCAADQEQPKYDYGKAELLGLIETANAGERWPFESQNSRFTLEVVITDASTGDEPSDDEKRASLHGLVVRQARACGTRVRSFSAVAAACGTRYETKLPVSAMAIVTRHDGGRDQVVAKRQLRGELTVNGLSFQHAYNSTIDLKDEALEISLSSHAPGDDFTLQGFLAPTLGVPISVSDMR
jgi:hypothetical protein